ncbi:MAG: hypothetical protein M1825_003634 [Sarcosagium campestre]|nr:MAG: hypothetical protein M1825_003634 [Sarcosagium campestre]
MALRGDPYRSSAGALDYESPRGAAGGGGGGGTRWDTERFTRERERYDRGTGGAGGRLGIAGGGELSTRFADDRDRGQRSGGRYFEDRDRYDDDYGGSIGRGGGRDRIDSGGTYGSRRRERSLDGGFGGGRKSYDGEDGYGGARFRGGGGSTRGGDYGGGRSRFEEERISRSRFEEERGGRSRRDSLYHEDDRVSIDSSPSRGSLTPIRSGGGGGGRPRRQSVVIERERDRIQDMRSPPSGGRGGGRPGMLRRQSSLDTFDRRPLPKYLEREQRIIRESAPVPPPRRRRSPPRRYEERDYEEIRIAEPAYYGNDEYHDFRDYDRGPRRQPQIYRYQSDSTFDDRIDDVPSARPGKTRIPKRLVEKSAIDALGYPFEEELDHLVILRALDRDRIDEVVRVSKELRGSGDTYTIEDSRRMIEGPRSPPPGDSFDRRANEIIIPAPSAPQPIVIPPPPPGAKETIYIDSQVVTGGSSGATLSPHHGPVSLDTIDHLTDDHDHHDHHGHHHGGGGSVISTRSRRSSKSRGRSKSTSRKHRSKRDHGSDSEDEEITRRRVVEQVESSSPVRGPLTMFSLPDRRKDERSIKHEIKELEREERALKRERKRDRRKSDHRRRSRSRSSDSTISGAEVASIKVEKDRRGKLSLVKPVD